MTNSIFPTLSLDRNKIHWEDYLHELTPVERHGHLWFKRDDAFAPLGMKYINGTKVRQGIYIFNKYVKGKYNGIIGGMSIHSPQHSMQSVVAKHYGVQSYHIIGATKPTTALKHEDIAIAAALGGRFIIIKVAYNPALQRAVDDYAEDHPEVYRLGYAISLPDSSTDAEIERFHAISAEQVRNIPNHIETLVIPCGSGNSTTSILYGLAKFKPKNLKNVYLIGIGPSKIHFVEGRLDRCTRASGINCKPFTRYYPQHKDVAEKYGNGLLDDYVNDSTDKFHYNLIFDDLHEQKLVKYGEAQPESYEGISFHENYEGKVWRRLKNYYKDALINPKTLFWIVGNKPTLAGLKRESSYEELRDMIKTNKTMTLIDENKPLNNNTNLLELLEYDPA